MKNLNILLLSILLFLSTSLVGTETKPDTDKLHFVYEGGSYPILDKDLDFDSMPVNGLDEESLTKLGIPWRFEKEPGVPDMVTDKDGRRGSSLEPHRQNGFSITNGGYAIKLNNAMWIVYFTIKEQLQSNGKDIVVDYKVHKFKADKTPK